MTDLYEIYNNDINLLNIENNKYELNDRIYNKEYDIDISEEINDLDFFKEIGLKDINSFIIDLSIKNSRLFKYFISGSPFILSEDYKNLKNDTINIKNHIINYDKEIINILKINEENIDNELRKGEQYNTEDKISFFYIIDRNKYNNNLFQIIKDYLEILIKYLTNYNNYGYKIKLKKDRIYERSVILNYYINIELNNNNLLIKYFYIIRSEYNDYINNNKLTYEWFEFEKTLKYYEENIDKEFNKYNLQDITTLRIYNLYFKNNIELELKNIEYYKLKNHNLNILLENKIKEILNNYMDIPSYRRYYNGYIFRFYGTLIIGNYSCISFILNKDFI
jgi:hypothetical protein